MADMGDQAQDRYIHLKEITIDFVKRRPTSDLELVFRDDAGVKHKSNKFKDGELVYWNLDTVVRTNTSAILTIRRTLFNVTVAEIEIKFRPNDFGDYRTVGLEDRNHNLIVSFVCGRSKSLADVTRIIGSQARNDPASKVLRFLKLPLLAALPPPTSEQGYDILYTAIHWLNDDILLEIFNCYRLDEKNHWNVRLGWCKLSQVCQRWRHLIYECASYLGMHIECTNGTPIMDTLDHLPPLPLFVNYGNWHTRHSVTLTRQDELGIYYALQLHDRVRHINFDLPPSVVHEALVLMDKPFPILEHLSIEMRNPYRYLPLTLPKAFLAPNLRYLALPSVSPPKRLRILTSTVSLVTLQLNNIQASSYFRPRLLVARLSSLPQLEKLSIGFSMPIPRPSTERERLGERGTPVTLPNLKALRFQGVSAYLESLIAQIEAPLLERLWITLFNQIVFPLPHLFHLVNFTEGFKLPTARVSFHRDSVSILTANNSQWSDGPFRLRVKCKQLDWQIDCAAQICGALIPALPNVVRLVLEFYDGTMPTEWENGEIDSTTWHELLRSFIGVRELHIDDGLLEEISRVVNEVGLDPGILPDLQVIFAALADNLFTSFIDARQVMGRPVSYAPPPLRPPPPAQL